jgi:transcriptional regulator GlxA family with amidase domain
LEESELALKAVAQRCGFGSVAAMRRLFQQRLGVTPVQYRDKFSAKETILAG